MTRTLIAVAAALLASSAFADESVRGYVRRDGTYVPPHQRSSPNDSRLDNYSTRGNVNPYTGERGTVDAFSPRPSGSRSSDSTFRPMEPMRPMEPLSPYGSQRRSRD